MIWVVVPALNEAENLQVLVPRIAKTLESMGEGGRVLVVDDGSTDDTRTVVAELAATWPGIEIDSLRHNQGKAAALQRGFSRAVDEGAEIVVMMDADGQDDPDELPRLVARLEQGADLVTGARLQRQDRFIKRNTSKVYNRVTGMLSGAPGRDFNSGYKVMTAEVARDVSPLMYGEMHRYLTVIAHQLGYRVVEEEVQHHPRMSGTSKYGLARFWRGFSDLVTVRFLLSYENRPSHLFGGVGAFCFFLGVVILGYLTVDKITGAAIGDRPLLLAGVLFTLVGLQLALFGLLAELIVHARNRDRATRL
jgi:glycosyltransferase involved in cell wall biosynthesis